MQHYEIETELFEKGLTRVCGLDEAGRGPLAGPVTGAAVILPRNTDIEGLNDSKLLTQQQRETLFEKITAQADYGIGIVDNHEIDRIGILEATHKAFEIAISNLKNIPEYLIIDGRDAFFFSVPYISVVKGDQKVRCIAAASILAKVTRDRIMYDAQRFYPQYNFRQHKGYGTRSHLEELAQYGYCQIHRKSFHPIKK